MMSDLFWLTDKQMVRLQPHFPKEPWPQTGRRSARFEQDHLRQPQRAQVVGYAEGIWPGKDAL